MTTKAQQDFINKVAPHAMKAQQDHGILASLTLAQAILESAWGKSSIGNNIFGIKANTTWKGKTQTVDTKEFINKKWVTVKATFRDYDSITDSIKDHTSLFTRLDRYANLRGEKDYKRACYLVWKDGYATDPDYPKKLTDIIEQHKLFNYDSQAVKTEVAAATVQAQFVPARDRMMKAGFTDGSSPKDALTREQSWAIFDRILLQLKKDEGLKAYGE